MISPRAFWALLTAILVSELAGVVGSVFTLPAIPVWYAGLKKPALSPPAWLFGPVWIILYLLMGLAAFLIWQRGRKRRDVRAALSIFGAQLVLNALWSLIFFGAHSPGWALLDISLLFLAVMWTAIVFYKIYRPAGYLLIPYFTWTGFATYLNYAVWNLNR